MEERKKELYFVTSLYLNAYLLTKDFEIVKTARLDNNKVALFYKESEDLHREIERFRNNYELKEFITQTKRVQDLIRIHKQREVVKDMFSWD
ncbi:DUF5659 domain-containing protein [Tissierella praeacuta]|uniref:DUF5659 domain-containing protein n=1 Tax=Tissierella praeacuta TaxID=43131 RepID=UPI003515CAD0